MRKKTDFTLVHVECGELSTPLLNTQLFERAYHQTRFKDTGAPIRTFVFAFEALTYVWNKKYVSLIRKQRKRYAPVKFLLMPYSSRMGIRLTVLLIKVYRFLFIRGRILFHCRGTNALQWVNRIRSTDDKVILDIRGYDPIEIFARANKFDPSDLTDKELIQFQNYESLLGKSLKRADRIFTVSQPLAAYIKHRFGIMSSIEVIPCVSSTLGLTESTADPGKDDLIRVVYVGGAQSYQGLQEMVIPFAQALLNTSPKIEFHFVSQDLPTIERYLQVMNVDSDRIIRKSVPQSEVKNYLKKMDLGLLLRSPSLMNSFSQPVKLGEYLAAGVGVIFEKGTGDLKALLEPKGIGFEVNLWNKSPDDYRAEAQKLIALIEEKSSEINSKCVDFSIKEYSWNKYSEVENKAYIDLMNG